MKINTANIDGYENMTAEQKLAALEAFEYEDGSDEITRLKKSVSDANAEASNWKKKHNQLLSEDEQKRLEQDEANQKIMQELESLRREKAISQNKAECLALGVDDKLADKIAEAIVNGDSKAMFGHLKSFISVHDKALEVDLLKNTPRPEAGESSKGMTLEQLRKMDVQERFKYANEHPEEYKTLYKNQEAKE